MESRPKTVLTGRMGKEDAEAFDAFADAHPRAAFQQSRAWAQSVPRARHDYLFFLCRDGAETIGTAIVRRSRLLPGVSLATVQRGPLAGPERLESVVEALKQALDAAGFSSLVLGPRFSGDGCAAAGEALARCGFAALPADEQALHIVTGKIALVGSEDDIFAGFKQRGRRAIRKVAERGTTVREATAEDLASCQHLLDAFHARRPDYDARSQPDVAAQARLVAALGGGLLVAEEAKRIVGFHSFVRQGRDAIWLAMAGEDDPQAPRGYLLVWEAVRRARALGLEHYDLAGLAPDGAESGRDQFKNAFAPVREELLPAHVAALRPLRHVVFFTLRRLYRRRRRG